MSSVNKVILIGRLGADPDVKSTRDGGAITNLSVATSERFKNTQGEWEERAEWHRVVIYGKPAEFAGNYARKGSQVYVEGKLKTRSWEDQQGVKRYTTEIVAKEFSLLGSRDNGNGGDGGNGGR